MIHHEATNHRDAVSEMIAVPTSHQEEWVPSSLEETNYVEHANERTAILIRLFKYGVRKLQY